MPSKGRNDNIYSKKVIHSLWTQKVRNYVWGHGPGVVFLPETSTVAERLSTVKTLTSHRTQ
jgi:hypothetical protein